MRSANQIGAAAAVFGALCLASIARAATIAYEGFAANSTGPSASLTSSAYSSADSSGWYSGWALGSSANNDGTLAGSGLTPPASATAYTLSPSGNAVLEQGLSSGYTSSTAQTAAGDFRSFENPASPLDTGTLWVSFLVQRQDTNSRFTGLSLYADGTTSGSKSMLDIGYNPNASGTWQSSTTWGMGGTNGGTAAINNASDAVNATNTNTALIVVEMAFSGSSANAYLWVNPSSSTDFSNPGSSAYEQITGFSVNNATSTLNGVDTVRIYAGGETTVAGFTANTSSEFDEIRIGTTAADVVPEPSGWAILSVPMLAGLARRRRRALA